jgi:hypothetical protein
MVERPLSKKLGTRSVSNFGVSDFEICKYSKQTLLVEWIFRLGMLDLYHLAHCIW